MQNEIFLILVILTIVIGLGINQAEGLVEFKKYKVINSPKVCGDKLCSEADENRAKKGLSSRDIKICDDRPCYDITTKKTKIINKSSPLGQFSLGVALDLIQCKEGHELVIKTTNSHPACIKKENVAELREKGWALSEEIQNKMFEKLIENRKKGIGSSKTIEDFEVTLNITSDEINRQRYLMFEGNKWHRLHNVEISISGEGFSESLLTKTDDRGHLSMPWPIPDIVGGRVYHIFATDGIHEFEIDIPIAPKDTMISETIQSGDRCTSITFPINWSDCDLYGKYLANIDLRMANLSGANLFGVTLTNKDLSGVDFSGASLKKGNLDGSILYGANFKLANLVDTKIRNADLVSANFHLAKAHRTDFTGSNLTNANFQDVTISYAILAGTDLKNANFENAGTGSTNLNDCKNHPICQ